MFSPVLRCSLQLFARSLPLVREPVILYTFRAKETSAGSAKQTKPEVKASDDVPRSETNDIQQEKTFEEIGVSKERVRMLEKQGITKMFPIQERTYSFIRLGKDLIGRSKTGTGKTLAFVIPLLDRYEKVSKSDVGAPYLLILTPTRELALQVHKEMSKIAPKLRINCVYGGHPVSAQGKNLQKTVDIVVGTPGRVLHFIADGLLKLNNINAFVLDEADQMLDIGFKKDLEEIMKVMPGKKQTILFSATIPQWVREMSKTFFQKPHIIDLVGTTNNQTPVQIEHQHIMLTLSSQRIVALQKLIRRYQNEKILVFVDTKSEAAELSSSPLICFSGSVRALHSDIKQEDRAAILDSFRNKVCTVLIASDIAARGLHIPDIDMIIHYRPAKSTENYIHRSGRCGRAGKPGLVVSLVTEKDIKQLKMIEKQIDEKIPEVPVPSDEQISHIGLDSVLASINKVPDTISQHFLSVANELIQSNPNSLASALALLSGFTNNNYSLMTGTEGYTTVRVQSTKENLSKAQAISYLHTLGGSDFGMAQVCPDGTAIIDCKVDQMPQILDNFKRKTRGSFATYNLQVLSEVPNITPTREVISFRQGAIAMHQQFSKLNVVKPEMNKQDDLLFFQNNTKKQ